jgi:hypothetical protein
MRKKLIYLIAATLLILLFTASSYAEDIGKWRCDEGLPSTITIYSSEGIYYFKQVYDDKSFSNLNVKLKKVGNKFIMENSPTGDYCLINSNTLKCYDNSGLTFEASPIKTLNKPLAEPTAGLSCYEIGVKFGRCGTLSLKGKACSPDDDIVVPERCRGKADTNKGIYDGTKSVY